MKDFFRSWRRKTGVATLVMACALSSLWVRSLALPIETGYELRTELRTSSIQVQLGRAEHHDEETDEPYTIYDNLFQFAIPYSAITAPLVLISAYLLLKKPRQQTKFEQPTNPAVNSD